MASASQNNIAVASQQYRGVRLAAAAYAATDITALLATNPSAQQLATSMQSTLIQQGFTSQQAQQFVSEYTPVAAMNQNGAGAILFRVNGTDQIAVAVRGTNPEVINFGDLQVPSFNSNDILSDLTIASNNLPAYQTNLIANWILRETTPAGQAVQQFQITGFDNNAGEAAAGVIQSGASAVPIIGAGVNYITSSQPIVQLCASVLGTGRALGTCVDAAGHSEGSPEVTVLGSAVAQCQNITTVNITTSSDGARNDCAWRIAA